MKLRIGLGYDLHRLVERRRLVLGGLSIPGPRGLAGHSDADVLVHAVIDALLGAAGEGDIGKLFPDTDPAFKNARSIDLLAVVMKNLRLKGMKVLHVDTVVVAEKPAVGPLVAGMKKILCPILGVSRDGLGIKGKTNEGIGVIGKGKAIACWAVALVREIPRRQKKRPQNPPVGRFRGPSAD